MTDKQKEAIEYLKKRIDICMENANICDDNDFDEEATCLRKEQILTETILNLLEKKDKIIDELEDIFYNYQLCEYELTDCTYRKCEYIADDEIPPCKACIKQYFERNAGK